MNGTSALIRASRGPILLITLGALFAIDYFGPYSIGRTWPALLIVFGLFKLMERMAATSGNPGTPEGERR